eukprot:c16814_g1_i2.p1 GENE.c16814_g1_i2~~c16814_g1_i2.p1  ORF type:complete len:1001 (+),score=178.98 c16814_g1_i2:424-3003(+)
MDVLFVKVPAWLRTEGNADTARIAALLERLFQVWSDQLILELRGSDPSAKIQSDDPFIRQLTNEKLTLQMAVDEYKAIANRELEGARGASIGPVQTLLAQLYHPLVAAIMKELDHIRCGDSVGSPDRESIGPFILGLAPEKMAVIVLHNVFNACLSNRDGARLSSLCLSMGRHLQAEHCMQMVKRRKIAFQELKYLPINKRSPLIIPFINSRATRLLDEDAAWTPALCVKIGTYLVGIALNALTIQLPVPEQESPVGTAKGKPVKGKKTAKPAVQDVPVLIHALESNESIRRPFGTFKRSGMIKINPLIHSTLQKTIGGRSLLNPTFQPMLVRPKPWLSPSVGSYFTFSHHVMRYCSNQQRAGLNSVNGKLDDVFGSLDALGRVGWRVHRRVFEVINTLWERGEGLGKLPSKLDKDVPECPCPDLFKIPYKNQTPEQRATLGTWRRSNRAALRYNSDLHSMRCDMSYRLETAQRFLDDVLYFPHNIDFRGRAYPIPVHLNHMGSDISRALLYFAEGKRLGAAGLRWLKIHLANLYGMDKLAFAQRVAFVDKNLDAIMRVAEDPLGEGRWWRSAGEPFQCLGACFVLAEALKLKNPEDYMCHLPIHQDGSCNGLQHYAALGRDDAGGRAVNLAYDKSDVPQDVYVRVLERVLERVRADAKAGDELALLLMGKVDRKVVKQTVMTSVYGVTFVGARDQIMARLSERELVPEDKLYECAAYLTRHTLAGLSDLFYAAFNIMQWLAGCAQAIAKQTGQPTSWTTPLNLRVVQPYHRKSAYSIRTIVQNVSLTLKDSTRRDGRDNPVAVGQQKTAFPPNFVHSLDATHMMMTALECEKLGLTFAAVHDSYWTHPGDVDTMNRVI